MQLDRPFPNIHTAFQHNTGFERMVELCTLLKGEGNDIAIAKLLKANLAHIYGYIFPLLESQSAQLVQLGRDIYLSLGRCVDMNNIDRESHKVMHKIALVILQNMSSRVYESSDGVREDMEADAFVAAIQSLQRKDSPPGKNASMFQSANTSTVEAVLHLKTWFERAETENEIRRLTDTMRMVVEQTKVESEQNKEIDASAVSICQHEILNLLGDPKFQQFTVENLKMLDALITLCSTDEKPDNQVVLARLLNKTVLKVIEVYETASKERDMAKRAVEKKERLEEFEGLGLLGLADNAAKAGTGADLDVWGWNAAGGSGGNLEKRLLSAHSEQVSCIP